MSPKKKTQSRSKTGGQPPRATSRSHNDLADLFASAVSTSTISAQTSTLLSGHLGDVVIAGAAGKPLEELEATDVTLVTVLLDASSSIGQRALEDAVRRGYNALLEAFRTSIDKDSLLVALWTFDNAATVVHAHLPVDEAAHLDASNYRAGGCTTLYDTWCEALASNVAYAQALRDGGTPCRSIVVVITDGEDCGSTRTPADCARIGRDLIASEQFVLAFVGVGHDVDFHDVARSMGVPEGCIEVARDATASSLQRLFQLVSRSVAAVSRGAVGPGQNLGFFSLP